MDKAKTLPRAKRDKSPSPSSSSFSSIKSATDKLGFKGLKKSVPLMHKKKKKVSITEPSSDNGNLNVTDDLSQETVGSPEATSTPTGQPIKSIELPDTSIAPTQELLKNPKKPKPPIKKFVKGSIGILQKFRNKNESAPIMVESATLDMRRETVKKDSPKGETDTIQEEIDEVTEVNVVSKDEWSTTATCEKVRKLSRLELHQSVYEEEVDGEVCSNPTTPEDEIFISEQVLSTQSESSTVESNNQSPVSFDKKSPSTIKKEILSSINSVKTRKTSEPIANGSGNSKSRKISMQERNSTDKNERLFKILVIGELGTGKTSFIKRYVHQFFSQHYRATIGVDFALKLLDWDENTTIRLQLWDIAGQERFGNMTRVYYKEAVGAFIVFDVTRASTMEAVTKWKKDLDSKVQLPDGEIIPCVLLANKCDQPKEGIVNNSSKMEEFCKENTFETWFETSAKDNINIEEAVNCLVSKVVQNDQKRQDEREVVNGTGTINISPETNKTNKGKCNAC